MAAALLLFPAARPAPGDEESRAAATLRERTPGSGLEPLPQEPELARIMAIGGGVSGQDLRRRLTEGLAAGKPDAELAPWLALLIEADPGALEPFLQSLPEDRRQALLLPALHQVRGDALWDALERSPIALIIARDEALKRGIASVLCQRAGSARLEDLQQLDAAHLRGINQERMEAGHPLELATLAQLPGMSREALQNYLTFAFPTQAAEVAEAMNHLDDLKLEPALREEFIWRAAEAQAGLMDDVDTALRWLELIPDEEQRNRQIGGVLQGLAHEEPERALQDASRLPGGPVRDDLILFAYSCKR